MLYIICAYLDVPVEELLSRLKKRVQFKEINKSFVVFIVEQLANIFAMLKCS